MKTILVVDDKQSVRQLLHDYLTEQGYRVVEADNGRTALARVAESLPDLILLDVMMPQMDGFQFISRFRRQSSVPILIVTAKQKEADVVRGFELGADDYIIKPFRLRELLMRMRAVLRRSGSGESAESVITVGDLTLDKQKRQAAVAGQPVELTPIELCLFECLMVSAEHTLTRAEICTHLIEHGYTGSENTLKIHVRNLRQKIERDRANPRYIETAFGVGYRLREVQT
ncbi:MAG: response regulator transcription factor [Candidatus Promineifilaceae bacterium]